MWPSSPIYERVPILWTLVGLLFSSSGLYLGFDYSLSFLYILIGGFCFVFGVALMLFRWREQPKSALDRRLSPKFVSAGATQVMQAMSVEAAKESADTGAADSPAQEQTGPDQTAQAAS